MTGAGAPGAPGIIKCLTVAPWINLVVGDANPEAVGRYLHPNFIPLPKANDENFVGLFLKLCVENKIDLVLPLVTKELELLAHSKKQFSKAGITILVSSYQAISIANNKIACYQFLENNAIQVPLHKVAKNVIQFKEAATFLSYPDKSFCFKPSQGNGSRGFRIVDENFDAADFLFTKKPGHTFIKYADAIDILSEKDFPELLVSEYLSGDEYSVDCIAQHGKTILAVPRLRSKMINGISTEGVFIKDETIENYCSQIIKALSLHGNIGIQLRKNIDGLPLLLEINPRVQGTIVAALGAGVNLPLLAIKQELGMPLEPHETTVQWGTRFWRYWTEVYSQT